MASPSQGKTGQSLGKASAELAWKLGLVVPSAALLHLPHPTPPLVGVSSPTTLTEVCLHTHPTHFLEVLLTVVSLSLSWAPKQTWTVSSCGEAPRTKSTHRRRLESRDYKEMKKKSNKPFCTQLSGESFLKDLLISTVCKNVWKFSKRLEELEIRTGFLEVSLSQRFKCPSNSTSRNLL